MVTYRDLTHIKKNRGNVEIKKPVSVVIRGSRKVTTRGESEKVFVRTGVKWET